MQNKDMGKEIRVVVVSDVRGDTEYRLMTALPGMMGMFSISIWVIITWVYPFVRSHQTILLRAVHFDLCKFYLNKCLTTNFFFKNCQEGTWGRGICVSV